MQSFYHFRRLEFSHTADVRTINRYVSLATYKNRKFKPKLHSESHNIIKN